MIFGLVTVEPRKRRQEVAQIKMVSRHWDPVQDGQEQKSGHQRDDTS